jgi:hypothetical protein
MAKRGFELMPPLSHRATTGLAIFGRLYRQFQSAAAHEAAKVGEKFQLDRYRNWHTASG